MLKATPLDPSANRISVSFERSETERFVISCAFGGRAAVEARAEPARLGLGGGLEALDTATREGLRGDASLPDDVASAVRRAAAGRTLGRVWLDLDTRTPLVAAVPWELLLRPLLDRALLLRLSPPPWVSWHTPEAVHVAAFVSTPVSERPIDVPRAAEALARAVFTAWRGETVLHLFVDESRFEETVAALGPLSDERGSKRIVPHRPPADAIRPASGPTAAGRAFDSPWLRWAADELEPFPVHTAHFVCHGLLTGDEGALCLAESPTRNEDREWPHVVSAGPLDAFLTNIRAQCVVLGGPPENYSPVGTRLLADRLARMRPGPVVLHETWAPSDDAALRDAYRLLYARTWDPDAGAAAALYCPPSFDPTPEGHEMGGWRISLPISSVDGEGPPVTTRDRLRRYVYGGDRFWPELRGGGEEGEAAPAEAESSTEPVWAATAREYVSQIAEGQTYDSEDSASYAGFTAAIDFVEDVIRRHADADASAPRETEREEESS